MAHEEWRDVVGYEGLYQVSNLGRVRSLDRTVKCRANGVRVYPGRMRKLCADNKGYKYVILADSNGHQRRFAVHRLVADAFIPRIDGKEFVDHVNNNPSDNNVANLRWCTRAENYQYAVECGAINHKERAKCLLSDDVRQLQRAHARKGVPKNKAVMRSDGAVFKSITEAAQSTGCRPSSIQAVLNGNRRTCYGYSFLALTD